MKTLFTLFLAGLFTMAQAQDTYQIDWMMGVNGEDASLTVEVGDTIIWVWAEDDMPHDVSSEDPNAPADFGSEILTGLGESYEYTFTEPAVFDYECSIHSATMFGTITVNQTVSVADKFAENVSLFPNPVQDRLTITSLFPLQQVEVYNLLGKRVVGFAAGGQTTFSASLGNLSAGVYFLNLTAENGQEAVMKVVVR